MVICHYFLCIFFPLSLSFVSILEWLNKFVIDFCFIYFFNRCDSFRSLYQLVRLYQCPYFYICTPTFTVLFRCAGAASIPVMHALISPTTKGFRQALKDEGTFPIFWHLIYQNFHLCVFWIIIISVCIWCDSLLDLFYAFSTVKIITFKTF